MLQFALQIQSVQDAATCFKIYAKCSNLLYNLCRMLQFASESTHKPYVEHKPNVEHRSLLESKNDPPPAVGGVGWLRPHCRGESRFQCPDPFRGKHPEPAPAPMLHRHHHHHRHHGHDRHHRHHGPHGHHRHIAIMAMIASSPSWPSSPHRHHGHHRLIATMAIIILA